MYQRDQPVLKRTVIVWRWNDSHQSAMKRLRVSYLKVCTFTGPVQGSDPIHLSAIAKKGMHFLTHHITESFLPVQLSLLLTKQRYKIRVKKILKH